MTSFCVVTRKLVDNFSVRVPVGDHHLFIFLKNQLLSIVQHESRSVKKSTSAVPTTFYWLGEKFSQRKNTNFYFSS